MQTLGLVQKEGKIKGRMEQILTKIWKACSYTKRSVKTVNKRNTRKKKKKYSHHVLTLLSLLDIWSPGLCSFIPENQQWLYGRVMDNLSELEPLFPQFKRFLVMRLEADSFSLQQSVLSLYTSTQQGTSRWTAAVLSSADPPLSSQPITLSNSMSSHVALSTSQCSLPCPLLPATAASIHGGI